MKRMYRSMEERLKLYKQINDRRSNGENLAEVLKEMNLSYGTYKNWALLADRKTDRKLSKKMRKPSVVRKLDLPVASPMETPRGMFVFYGSPAEVASLVRIFQ